MIFMDLLNGHVALTHNEHVDLRNGHVDVAQWLRRGGETQEDLSIVPCKGDQKRQKRAHEKPTITLLEVFILGQFAKIKSICPHWMLRQS
jgi:hypothetical protein